MTRDRIYLISETSGKVNSFYTLGAITDDSNLNMVIQSEIYGDNNVNPFNKKDLVSKAFNLKSFKEVSSFEIISISELKKFAIPLQPYKIKIGSGVRYKSKSYQVIGFYYNTFAQRNVVSPILFNPQSMISDALNLLYGIKTDDDVLAIINDNFRAGKYDEDFNFPILPTVTDFKDYLSNITEPPLTTLDVIQISKSKNDGVLLDLKPYKFERSQVDFSENIKKAFELGESEDIANAETFEDFRLKNKFSAINPFDSYLDNRLDSVLEIKNVKINSINLPYNLVDLNNVSKKGYQSILGEIMPIYALISNSKFKYEYDVTDFTHTNIRHNIFATRSQTKWQSGIINAFLFNKESTLKNLFDFNLNQQDFIEKYQSFLLSNVNSAYLRVNPLCYVLKPDTYYGGFYFSSGYEDLNPNTHSDILPFGSIFQRGGIYYYVLKYVRNDKDTLCVCIKTSTKTALLGEKFGFDTKSELKSHFKIFTKDQVYDAFKKEGHIFEIEDSSYSIGQQSSKSNITNTSLVTDLFLKSRQDQMEIIEKNFPQLNDTVIGILSLLDKSIRKNKSKDFKLTKDLVYVQLSNFVYRPKRVSFDSGKINRFKLEIENLFEKNTNITDYLKLTTTAFISDELYELGLNTSFVQVSHGTPLFFALKSFEDYQKYLLVRNSINLNRNLLYMEIFARDEDISIIPPQNQIAIMTSDYFLEHIGQTSYDIIGKESRTIDVKNSRHEVIANAKMPSVQLDYIKFAQSAFVLNALSVLVYNIRGVIASHIDRNSTKYIQSSNLLQYLKKFDLSLNIDFIFENYNKISFRVGSYTNDYVNTEYNLSQFEGERIFNASNLFVGYRQMFNIDFTQADSKEAFIQLIKQVDFIYNYEFLLTDRIIDNTSNVILTDFPRPKPEVKPTEVEFETEVEFDDDDIFSEALEDLGDDFLADINEIINIDIEDF